MSDIQCDQFRGLVCGGNCTCKREQAFNGTRCVDTKKISDHNYHFVHYLLSYDEANKYCHKNNMYLVTINEIDEIQKLAFLFSNQLRDKQFWVS